MKNYDGFSKKWRGPLVIAFATLLIVSGVIVYLVLEYNDKSEVVSADSDNKSICLEMDANNPKGERWESLIKVADNPEKTVLYTGETVNCTLFNTNDFDIKKWSLKIAPKSECYLNGFWGGSVEVHQFRAGKEVIESVPGIVAASEIKELDINSYTNSMMIRLIPGDYIVYSPVVDINVDYIRAKDSTGIVFNFYYTSPLDFSDYEITYHNDVKLKDIWVYKVMVAAWTLWLIGLIFFHSVLLVNKRVIRDAKTGDQNISAMADLYLETYRLNIDRQTGYLINGKREKPILILEKGNLQQNLNQYVMDDCSEVFTDELSRFLDLSTLEQRMADVSSIVFEYKSKEIGWCSLRFFKLTKKDRNQYVLAFQDINEERHKLHEYEEHIRQAENSTLLQGDFMDTIYYALSGMSFGIRSDMMELAKTLSDDNQKELASGVGYNIEHLILLGSFVYDLFAIEADRFRVSVEVYSIHEMIKTLQGMIAPFKVEKNYDFQINVDDRIPNKLKGDRKRLMQILVVLLSSSILMTEKGYVKLSIFGKQNGNKEELLISIRDTTVGFTEEQLDELRELMNNSHRKYTGNAAYVYFQIMNQILKKMNSELKIVSSYGSGSEFYFTIEQEIVDEMVTL